MAALAFGPSALTTSAGQQRARIAACPFSVNAQGYHTLKTNKWWPQGDCDEMCRLALQGEFARLQEEAHRCEAVAANADCVQTPLGAAKNGIVFLGNLVSGYQMARGYKLISSSDFDALVSLAVSVETARLRAEMAQDTRVLTVTDIRDISIPSPREHAARLSDVVCGFHTLKGFELISSPQFTALKNLAVDAELARLKAEEHWDHAVLTQSGALPTCMCVPRGQTVLLRDMVTGYDLLKSHKWITGEQFTALRALAVHAEMSRLQAETRYDSAPIADDAEDIVVFNPRMRPALLGDVVSGYRMMKSDNSISAEEFTTLKDLAVKAEVTRLKTFVRRASVTLGGSVNQEVLLCAQGQQSATILNTIWSYRSLKSNKWITEEEFTQLKDLAVEAETARLKAEAHLNHAGPFGSYGQPFAATLSREHCLSLQELIMSYHELKSNKWITSEKFYSMVVLLVHLETTRLKAEAREDTATLTGAAESLSRQSQRRGFHLSLASTVAGYQLAKSSTRISDEQFTELKSLAIEAETVRLQVEAHRHNTAAGVGRAQASHACFAEDVKVPLGDAVSGYNSMKQERHISTDEFATLKELAVEAEMACLKRKTSASPEAQEFEALPVYEGTPVDGCAKKL